MKTIKLNIDGKIVEVEEGTTILQAARLIGADIPTLCYDERLTPYGGCRLCTVEITTQNKTKFVASCIYPVQQGLLVNTDSEIIRKIRKMIIELILPISPTGPLEKLAARYHIKKSRFKAEKTSCILCGLCVRYCAEIKKAKAIDFVGRGINRNISAISEIAPYMCSSCRECLSICPSGGLISIISNRNMVSQ